MLMRWTVAGCRHVAYWHAVGASLYPSIYQYMFRLFLHQVGLPVAVFLALYLDWGTQGLWSGIALMNILQGSFMAYQV